MSIPRLMSRAGCAAAIVLATFFSAPAIAADEAIVKDRMEKLLADGDEAIATAVFRRHIDDALGFIDQYMEGGLKIIESGGSADDAMKSFRIGIRFAGLADQAAPGAGFAEYATNFASWTPAEQKRFRDGQAAFKAGREAMKDDPAQAVVHLRRAATIADSLGDTWGVAMAFSALARAELDHGRPEKVEEAARRANELNTKLHQRLAMIRVLLAWGDSQIALQSRGAGSNIYGYAFNQLREGDPPSLREEVTAKFTQALELSGQQAMAQQIKAQAAEADAANAPPAQPMVQPGGNTP